MKKKIGLVTLALYLVYTLITGFGKNINPGNFSPTVYLPVSLILVFTGIFLLRNSSRRDA